MGSGGILVTNERLARLTGLAEDALGSRDFSLAEELYSEKLQMLREFRYVDDLELAKTTNMLAFSQECQNKIEQAAKNRLATLDFCANKKLMTSPMQRPPLAPKLSRQAAKLASTDSYCSNCLRRSCFSKQFQGPDDSNY